MTGLAPAAVRKGFERARERRQPWEPLWRECYAYALPQRGAGLGAEFATARRYSDGLFDGTAADAVEQLAASLLAELTPPWSQWFGFRPGPRRRRTPTARPWPPISRTSPTGSAGTSSAPPSRSRSTSAFSTW